MAKGIEKLLEGRSAEELMRLATAAQQLATGVQLKEADESLIAKWNAVHQRVLATGDPRILTDLGRYVGKYQIHRRGARQASEEREPWKVYDKRRPRIESLVFRLADDPRHSKIMSEGVTAQYVLDNIPELRKEGLVKNPRALSNYFKTFMKERGARIKKGKEKGQYIFTQALTRDQVYKMADAIEKKKGWVAYIDIEGHPRRIGALLAQRAKERHRKSEVVSMGKKYGHVTIYFKGRRPPITPKELVEEYVGKRKNVSHSSIARATGLEERAILTIMTGVLGYETEGSGRNKTYIR